MARSCPPVPHRPARPASLLDILRRLCRHVPMRFWATILLVACASAASAQQTYTVEIPVGTIIAMHALSCPGAGWHQFAEGRVLVGVGAVPGTEESEQLDMIYLGRRDGDPEHSHSTIDTSGGSTR